MMILFALSYLQDLSTGWLYCDPGPLFKPKLYYFSGIVPEWVNLNQNVYYFSFIILILSYNVSYVNFKTDQMDNCQ